MSYRTGQELCDFKCLAFVEVGTDPAYIRVRQLKISNLQKILPSIGYEYKQSPNQI